MNCVYKSIVLLSVIYSVYSASASNIGQLVMNNANSMNNNVKDADTCIVQVNCKANIKSTSHQDMCDAIYDPTNCIKRNYVSKYIFNFYLTNINFSVIIIII